MSDFNETPADELAEVVDRTGGDPVEGNPIVETSSFVRVHSERRRRKRRLAAILTPVFFVAWLGFGATFERSRFEKQQEERTTAALTAMRGINVRANGRDIILTGSVLSAAEKAEAEQLAKGVNFVRNVDVSQLTVGEPVGNVLPLTIDYVEGTAALSGVRPSDTALNALTDAAAKGLGDGRITSEFADAAGVGGDEDAYAALGSVLGSFPGLGVRSATVVVSDIETRIVGTIADDARRAEIIEALRIATGVVARDELVVEQADVTTGAGTPATSLTTDEATTTALAESSDATTLPGQTTIAGVSTTLGGPTTTPSVPVTPSTLTPNDRQVLQDELSATLKQSPIEFATDSSFLSAQSKATLARIADRLRPLGVALEVGGHTDSRGKPERNVALSQRRADAVREELIRLGISSGLVSAKGYGSAQTIAPDGARGNPLNRRIEITVF
jgi:outer membrane protein OmpA-like peptidoglycan-associated protein